MTKRFYIRNDAEGRALMDGIVMDFPCWIIKEPVEMDFVTFTVKATEDCLERISKKVEKVVDKY